MTVPFLFIDGPLEGQHIHSDFRDTEYRNIIYHKYCYGGMLKYKDREYRVLCDVASTLNEVPSTKVLKPTYIEPVGKDSHLPVPNELKIGYFELNKVPTDGYLHPISFYKETQMTTSFSAQEMKMLKEMVSCSEDDGAIFFSRTDTPEGFSDREWKEFKEKLDVN